MHAGALSDRARRASLAAVMLHMLGIGLTLGLTFPLTSLTLERWDASSGLIGLAGAMPALAILIFMPVLPGVAARLGAVRAMSLGCGVGIAGLCVMYLIQTAPVWIAARFVIGAGLALPWLAGDVWINSIAPDRSRGRVIAGYVACLFIGFSTGPPVLDAIGIDGVAPFAASSGALALAVVPLVLVRRFAPAVTVEARGNVLSTARAMPVVAVGAFLAGVTEAMIFSLLTIWGLGIGLDETATLRLLTTSVIGGVILQLALGVVADLGGRQRLLGLIGLGAILAGICLHASAGIAVFVAAFSTGGLVLALYAVSLTLLGERFPPDRLAVASAAFLILYQIGSMIGPVAVGLAMDLAGPIGFVAALCLAGLAMAGTAFGVRNPADGIGRAEGTR